MPVLNTFQYKQCLCILALTKYNEQFIDQICIMHRPEEKKNRSEANDCKENFCQCKN